MRLWRKSRSVKARMHACLNVRQLEEPHAYQLLHKAGTGRVTHFISPAVFASEIKLSVCPLRLFLRHVSIESSPYNSQKVTHAVLVPWPLIAVNIQILFITGVGDYLMVNISY